LLGDGVWTVIAGLFDPLTALQARRVEKEARGRTLVVVLENSDTLLPADARCHLMAALRSVDFVVQASEQDWHSITLHGKNVQVIDDKQAEKQRSQDFVELVISRQGEAAVISGQNH